MRVGGPFRMALDLLGQAAQIMVARPERLYRIEKIGLSVLWRCGPKDHPHLLQQLYDHPMFHLRGRIGSAAHLVKAVSARRLAVDR